MFSFHRYGYAKQLETRGFDITREDKLNEFTTAWRFMENTKEKLLSIDRDGRYGYDLMHIKPEFDMRVIFDLVETKTRKVVHREKPLMVFASDSHGFTKCTIDRSIDKWPELEIYWRMIIFTRDAELPSNSSSGPVAEMLKNLRYLFVNRDSSADVTVQASDGIEIRVHKLILTTQSSYFKTMFEIDMTEKESSYVKIKDFDSKVLTELFKFMYCGEADTNVEINTELLRAAKRYEVSGLSNLCENYIIDNFNDIDIWPILEIAHTFDMQELFEFTATIFFVNDEFYSEQPEWKDQKDMALTSKVYKFFHKLNEKESKKHWRF